MTIAVCWRCGHFKHGALTPCEKCNALPRTDQDIALSIGLSDHYHSQPQLEVFSQEIVLGKKPSIDPKIISDYLETLKDNPLKDLWNQTNPFSESSFFDTPDPEIPITQQIAVKLNMVESMTPGSLRLRINPFLVDRALGVISSTGRKKPLLKSKEAFLRECVISSAECLALLLPSTLLAGPKNPRGLVRCWCGNGKFTGLQGLIQLTDFSSGGKEGLVMIFDISGIFAEVENFLEPPMDNSEDSSVIITCQNCGQKNRVKPHSPSQIVKCGKCGSRL